MTDYESRIFDIYDLCEKIQKQYYSLCQLIGEANGVGDISPLEKFRDKVYMYLQEIDSIGSQIKILESKGDKQNIDELENLIMLFNETDNKSNNELQRKLELITQNYVKAKRTFLNEVKNVLHGNNNYYNHNSYNNIDIKFCNKNKSERSECSDSDINEFALLHEDEKKDIKGNKNLQKKILYSRSSSFIKQYESDFKDICKKVDKKTLFGIRKISKVVVKKVASFSGYVFHSELMFANTKAFEMQFEFENNDQMHLESDFIKRLKEMFETYLILIETGGTKIKIGGNLKNVKLSLTSITSDEFLKCYRVILLDIIGYNFISDVYMAMKTSYTKSNIKQEDIENFEK
jgi:hypothetical protein